MLTALVALAAAVPATASVEIEQFEVTSTTSQAGGHPDLEARFALAEPGEPEVAKDVVVSLPRGVFGNPNAADKCSSEDFALEACPIDSQIGTITVRANYGGDDKAMLGTAPVYNMESRSPDETARLAFIAPTVDIPVNIPILVRTDSDYGLDMKVSTISQEIPLYSADITIWGFPAATVHDNFRFVKGSPGAPAGCPGEGAAFCASTGGQSPHGSAHLLQPLIDNPSVCTAQPLSVKLTVTTYQDEANPSGTEDQYDPTTGCDQMSFNPVFRASLTSNRADTPAGLEMQLKADQFLGEANSSSALRSASLTLPVGLSINPDAADGQLACSDAAARLDSRAPAACPDTSKIGTFDIQTPALDGPLNGSLYFGEPKPGNQYRVFMVAEGFGIVAKFVAPVLPDPVTGQLSMGVSDLPPVPFEQFNLHLFASDRGLVATPTQCRLYEADSVFTPWNSVLAAQHSSSQLSISAGPDGTACPGAIRPFHPTLVAGSSNALAGAFSEFHLRLDREDGDQFLGDLNFRMPPGFTGSLRGLSYCPDSAIAHAIQNPGRVEQASPSCPASSAVGTSNVAAGPGSHPFHALGKMYLAGRFKGAPLSLAVVTPALAGPYDYGTVVVRVALHVNPRTAQVSAVSDTVPSIVGGVPIRMRSIQINIDKPEFTLNPTNCSPFSVDSQGIGDQGTVADFSSFFHVVNCANLGFKPRMTIKQLGGHKSTRRSADPRIRFEVFTRPGDANLRSVAVTLPKAFAIDQRHLGNLCSKAQLQQELCAGRQAIGTVRTDTPLLDKPLEGPAYAVSGFGKLPHIAFILDGQVTLVPEAESSSVKGRLKTTVPVVPDAPMSHFQLTLLGNKEGYLVNTRNLCGAPVVTTVQYVGQNNKRRTQRVLTKPSCPGSSGSRPGPHR